MNKEEIEDYKKLSGEITEKLDNTSTYESWLIIQEYIDRQQQENKELSKTCELYSKSLYNADLTKAKQKLEEKEKIIEDAIEYAKHYKEYLKYDGRDYLKSSRDYGLEEDQVDELLSILERK